MDIYSSQPGSQCAHPSACKIGFAMNSSASPSTFKKVYDAEVAKTAKKDDSLVQSSTITAHCRKNSSVELDSNAPANFFQSFFNQVNIYKQEQLLAHPGGENVGSGKEAIQNGAAENQNIFSLVAKDCKDGLANFGNFFKDLLWGSEQKYADGAGQVKTTQKTGLLGNVVSALKDLASALSFGKYFTDEKIAPQGIFDRALYSVKTLFQSVIFNDIVYGIPSSTINLLDDSALGVLNLMEAVPEAVLGNIPGGHSLVTTIFDNGQVAVDYITDCLPAGSAWMRVHGFYMNDGKVSPPLLFNLTLPERYADDSRWSTVQNTPFRKTIETIGSLLGDFGLGMAAGLNAPYTSQRRD